MRMLAQIYHDIENEGEKMKKHCPNCQTKNNHTLFSECGNCLERKSLPDLIDDFAEAFIGKTAIEKAEIISQKGFSLAGVVLQKEDQIAIVSELGRVEWFSVDQIWRKH